MERNVMGELNVYRGSGVVFDAANGNGERVVPVSTADYYANAEGPVAPRPVHSALDLSRLEAAGFHMPDWKEELGEYLDDLCPVE